MVDIVRIGSFSLNLSFILYLILYLPQLLHNREPSHIKELSPLLHLLLYLSYWADLVYGFSGNLPWQYRTVSIVGVLLLSLQHIQFIQLFFRTGEKFLAFLAFIFLLFMIIGLLWFFLITHTILSPSFHLTCGVIARTCGLMCCLPQIFKNRNLESAKALSSSFLWMNLSLSLLDTVSAWCLGWGWPNKLSAPIASFIGMILLAQNKRYHYSLRSHRANNRLSIIKSLFFIKIT